LKTANDKENLKRAIEDLTGQKIQPRHQIPSEAVELLIKKDSKGLGHSQFNELLLSLGFDRVSHSFFQFLADGSTKYRSGASITSLEKLREGIDAFRKIAILFFGNVKFAFKHLSRDATFLNEHLRRFTERREQSFYDRHQQIMLPNIIGGEDTYLLGYVIKKDLETKLAASPNDASLQTLEKKRLEIVEKGKKNHDGYLVSDHLDVYIATSMRERHEFTSVHETTRAIFQHEAVANLKLRWFDPTQAFCEDRIDKGLAEGLMLKRARCTIYFAQESDTFGKDSELASTLAQGKPVIAFVPQPAPTAAEDLLKRLVDGDGEPKAILRQLQVYEPSAAWTDPQVRVWLEAPEKIPRKEAVAKLQKAIEQHFQRRNSMLREVHPLGVQINLQTGVANGVLVANSVDQCARLVRALLLRQLQFDLSTEVKGDKEYLFLRETITKCIFRVVTGDTFLTNAFWNFYLNPIDEPSSKTNTEDEEYKKSKIDPYDLTRFGARQGALFDYLGTQEAKTP
jgi:hypothetical protein